MKAKNLKEVLLVAGFFTLGLSAGYSQTVKDADGNIYMTIKIGNQIWTAENLKTTKLNDGKPIPLVTDDKKWKAMKGPAYCWYKNDPKYKDISGALYNWYTVKTGKLCPAGWHVPKAEEWQVMVSLLGEVNEAATKLKEAGLEHWKNPYIQATNDYDFTAVPSGLRLSSGVFPVSGDDYAVWWSASAQSSFDAWNCGLHDSSSGVFHGHDNMGNGLSVRCIKD